MTDGSRIANLVLRPLQVLLVLIATALIGNVRQTTLDHKDASYRSDNSAALNFSLFVCALAWIVALGGLAAQFFFKTLAAPLSKVLDPLAILFTFIAAVVLSAKLKATDCANAPSHAQKHHGWIASLLSKDNRPIRAEGNCRDIQGGLVFLWFLFAAFCLSYFLFLNEWRKTRGAFTRPSMSQIGV
ncbi:marvel domain-containing protein [Xylariaceae sp. FL1019]|nr:marvel domain-containing protein [Xylariaceae sp. FL1019]